MPRVLCADQQRYSFTAGGGVAPRVERHQGRHGDGDEADDRDELRWRGGVLRARGALSNRSYNRAVQKLAYGLLCE